MDDNLEAASQEASDNEEGEDDEEEYETMTMTEAGDVGEQQVKLYLVGKTMMFRFLLLKSEFEKLNFNFSTTRKRWTWPRKWKL
jgi:hypothetical protein